MSGAGSLREPGQGAGHGNSRTTTTTEQLVQE
jgi:hypothetical protein